jgi:hypothetical protein
VLCEGSSLQADLYKNGTGLAGASGQEVCGIPSRTPAARAQAHRGAGIISLENYFVVSKIGNCSGLNEFAEHRGGSTQNSIFRGLPRRQAVAHGFRSASFLRKVKKEVTESKSVIPRLDLSGISAPIQCDKKVNFPLLIKNSKSSLDGNKSNSTTVEDAERTVKIQRRGFFTIKKPTDRRQQRDEQLSDIQLPKNHPAISKNSSMEYGFAEASSPILKKDLNIHKVGPSSKVLAENLGEGPNTQMRLVTLAEIGLSRQRLKSINKTALAKSDEQPIQQKHHHHSEKTIQKSYLARAELFKGGSGAAGMPSHWNNLSECGKDCITTNTEVAFYQDSLELLETSEFDYLQVPKLPPVKAKPLIKIKSRQWQYEPSKFSVMASREPSLKQGSRLELDKILLSEYQSTLR